MFVLLCVLDHLKKLHFTKVCVKYRFAFARCFVTYFVTLSTKVKLPQIGDFRPNSVLGNIASITKSQDISVIYFMNFHHFVLLLSFLTQWIYQVYLQYKNIFSNNSCLSVFFRFMHSREIILLSDIFAEKSWKVSW